MYMLRIYIVQKAVYLSKLRVQFHSHELFRAKNLDFLQGWNCSSELGQDEPNRIFQLFTSLITRLSGTGRESTSWIITDTGHVDTLCPFIESCNQVVQPYSVFSSQCRQPKYIRGVGDIVMR